jgi:hypothetical protein
MPKQRRTVLSGIALPLTREVAPPAAVVANESAAPVRRATTKERTVQQTLYLPVAVHEQLSDLAHSQKVKMHTLALEGLDAVFRRHGLKSIAELTKE